MASFPTYIFNGNVSSQKGYYVNNILIAQTGGSNNIVDINPNGATGSGTANQLTFFHNSDKGTTTPYILIDNTSTSSTQTASVRFLSADGNTTYGSIVGNTTGLNFNNNGSIGYITMTLGTGSTSSTLNFVKPDNSLYGSIVGNTTGLNLTSTSNLNIAGSGASSTVQINNFKTLNITGVDATSSVVISSTSLNAPGLATLTTPQVGTPLYIDSNNNIVKLPNILLNLSRSSITELMDSTKGYYVNHGLVDWHTGTGALRTTSGVYNALYVTFLLINVNGNIPYGNEIYRGWPTNTTYNSFTNVAAIPTTLSTSGTSFFGTNTSLPTSITSKFIKFPTPGLYSITLNISFINPANPEEIPKYTIDLIKNATNFLERNNTWANTISRVINTSSSQTITGIIIINNDGSSATPDTLAIRCNADSLIDANAGRFYRVESFQLTITRIAPL